MSKEHVIILKCTIEYQNVYKRGSLLERERSLRYIFFKHTLKSQEEFSMDLLQAMYDRHSVRAYTEHPIEGKTKEDLVSFIDQCSRESVMHTEQTPPDWFLRGIDAALLAPTAMNQQKFVFSLKGNTVTAKAGIGFYSKIDLGIAKYHFELGAGTENFRWG